MLKEIQECCRYSSVKLAYNKCKTIHIYRKQTCTHSIICNNFSFKKVDNLKIFGVYLDKRYRRNIHIDYLASLTVKQVNIAKCLSSAKLNCNSLSLVSVVKAILLNNINCGLPIPIKENKVKN